MLHSYVERVWSFGYVFSWEFIHYWSEYAQKKKKAHSSLNHSPLGMCMDVPVCFIQFMCQREFVWELIYEILSWCIFWVRVWVIHSIFVKETRDLSLVSLNPCSIHHSTYFGCDYFLCFDAGWPSLIFLPLCFLVSLFCSSIPLYLIWFLSFLILLDVWLGFSIHTSYMFVISDHSFIITFRVRTPRSGTHDVFYASHLMHEGYGDYIIGIFGPSFLSFLSPYYLGLRYVPCLKTTLRPLLHIVFDGSHMGNTRD